MKTFQVACLSIFISFGFTTLQSQNTKLYNGPYESGTANYQYYENSNFERIYNGTFKYKGTIVDQAKGKINVNVVGQYKENKKDGKWTYTLTEPSSKGTTQVVTGSYINGMMDGEWTVTTTVISTKKVIKKNSANFKSNKLTGALSLELSSPQFKEYSSVSFKGTLNDSSYFDGVFITLYTQNKIQYEETRRYRDGVLSWLLLRRLSDGVILEKIDSVGFTDQFFAGYDPIKKLSQVGKEKYIFNTPEKYSGMLDIAVVATKFWTEKSFNSYYNTIYAPNPMFLIEYGYKPSTGMHERTIINWNKTREGEKASWQEEQDRKAMEEKYRFTVEKADIAFNAKQYDEATKIYLEAIAIRDEQYPKDQLKRIQTIKEEELKALEQERLAKEQEILAKEQEFNRIIAMADSALNVKKYNLAIDLYTKALAIKDEARARNQITFVTNLRNEEIKSKTIQDINKLWVTLEGGTFKMGCFRSDIFCLKIEEPVHEVMIGGFSMTKYEITNGIIKGYLEIKGLPLPEGADNEPATNISWNMANEFAQWVGFRLPTEAEWEYAARGGIKNRKSLYSGANELDNISWYYENSDKKVHPVGQKMPNSSGLYDMSGNVWEWCYDWFGDYRDLEETNPQGPSNGSQKIKRGGSFNDVNFEADLRVTNRSSEPIDYKSYNLGFRLVKK